MVYHANFPNLKGPRAPSQNCKKNPCVSLTKILLLMILKKDLLTELEKKKKIFRKATFLGRAFFGCTGSSMANQNLFKVGLNLFGKFYLLFC